MLFLFPLFSLSHKSAEGRSSYSLSYKVTVHINKEGCEYEEAKTVDVTLLECTCLQFVVASFQRFFFSWPLDQERNCMKLKETATKYVSTSDENDPAANST